MKLSPSAIKALNNFPILVFEEINPDNLKYVKLGSLSLEGLAHPQWISYVKKWHVIYPAVAQVCYQRRTCGEYIWPSLLLYLRLQLKYLSPPCHTDTTLLSVPMGT